MFLFWKTFHLSQKNVFMLIKKQKIALCNYAILFFFTLNITDRDNTMSRFEQYLANYPLQNLP